ncbi:Protein of unknown function (DUF2874) [Galbibacter orientalis DSM 19592]|uniref:Putative beta-lactamase-inhibitor-like PepSY-like domain-containing protein n=1 Tax=Galbibacter orientalis DSM 19592 TaxID=926559 RepID=I3C6R8_9FLAO|nr:PepSY-like domain-containing protein [Galbibacter orientalis]EIJ39311.1 Protein of unknown function (DUF2874) [Galbibacter orientalis DSM 19592]
MKKAILGIGLLFLAITAVAFTTRNQEKVPQTVKNAFAKKFPTAKKVDWGKESNDEWEAEFKMDNREYSANFLQNGTWMETEHEIEKSEVPNTVISSLKSNFPGYDIESAEMTETTDGKFYEFEIEKGNSEMEVVIDNNGKVVKKYSEEDEEVDED